MALGVDDDVPTQALTLSSPSSFCKQFHEDGFVVIRNILPKNLLDQWKSFVTRPNDNFDGDLVQWLFRELHRRGHTPFPQEFQLAATEDVSDNDDADNVMTRCVGSTSSSSSSSSVTAMNKRQYALGHGVKHGFAEIVMRSPGRYEISLLNMMKHNQASNHDTFRLPLVTDLYPILESAGVPQLLSKRNWNQIKVTNVSIVVSTPGAACQGWHSDGPHVNPQKHLPAHVMNVFLALDDVTTDLGPTELRPGSASLTRNLGPLMLAARCRKTLRKPVTPLLQAGDALVFDYRILHRGLANLHANRSRYILVVTVAQDWFEDVWNFPRRSLFGTDEKASEDDDDNKDRDANT